MAEFVDRLPSTENRRNRGAYNDFASQCKEKPFVWGILPRRFETKNQCSNVTSGIKRGDYAAFRPSEEWEAAQRSGKVYVRYVGKGSDAD